MSQPSFTRNDLATELAARQNCSVESAKATVEHIITAVSSALSAGKKVEFRGFGVLEVVQRKPKIGRNPKDPSGGTYTIPARAVVKFRAGKELDETLNREGQAAVSA
jgi:integration host factor subunit beta